MEEIHTSYFQKSKVFLYPLLKLKRGIAYVPRQTYVCWEHEYTIKDCKLLCEYHAKPTNAFITFSNNYLKGHKLFYKYVDLNENRHLFIFDLTPYKSDFNRFIGGRYSQFSLESKLEILDFFLSSQKMSNHMHDFLSPEFAHDKYARILGVDIKEIKEVYEVCSILDLNKETFQNDNLEINSLLNNNAISLVK